VSAWPHDLTEDAREITRARNEIDNRLSKH
jgi:hypothetical protein